LRFCWALGGPKGGIVRVRSRKEGERALIWRRFIGSICSNWNSYVFRLSRAISFEVIVFVCVGFQGLVTCQGRYCCEIDFDDRKYNMNACGNA
jgi:hypothetical protein